MTHTLHHPKLTGQCGRKPGSWVWESSTAAEIHRQLCCPARPWTAVPRAAPGPQGKGGTTAVTLIG